MPISLTVGVHVLIAVPIHPVKFVVIPIPSVDRPLRFPPRPSNLVFVSADIFAIIELYLSLKVEIFYLKLHQLNHLVQK